MTNTPDYDIGDILRAALGCPLDAVVQATSEPAIEEQVRPPTKEELAEITELAEKAARLQDEVRELVGDKNRELSALKKQLKQKFLDHGMEELQIAGRPPIELTTSNARKANRKTIVAAYQKRELELLTDEQRRDPKAKKKAEAEGKRKGLNLWNTIDMTTSHSLSIPDPSPPDLEPDY